MSDEEDEEHAEDERSVRAAIAGELRLLDPAVRASADLVSALLDPGFAEFGASGRRYDAASILGVTSSASAGVEPAVRVSDMEGVLLAPGVVHLTYLTDDTRRRVRRSSLWRFTPWGWRLYFHQGTPTHEA